MHRLSVSASILILAGLLTTKLAFLWGIVRVNLAALDLSAVIIEIPPLDSNFEPNEDNRIRRATALLASFRSEDRFDRSRERWQMELGALIGSGWPSRKTLGLNQSSAEGDSSCITMRAVHDNFGYPLSLRAITKGLLRNAELAAENGEWKDSVTAYQMVLTTLSQAPPDALARAYHQTLAHYYQEMCVSGRDPGDCLVSLKLFWLAQESSRAAEIAVNNKNSLLKDPTASAWGYFVQGIAQEEVGKDYEAQDSYIQAEQIDPSFGLNLLQLQKLAQKRQRPDLLELVGKDLRALTPTYYTWRPGVMLTDALPGGWRLEGFDLDRSLLEAGSLSTVVTLHWLPPSGDLNDDSSPEDSRFLQVSVLPNLILNSSFEWDWARCLSKNSGLWKAYFSEDACCSIPAQSEAADRHYAAIGNSPEEFDSLQSGTTVIRPSSIYLAGGWQSALGQDDKWHVITFVNWSGPKEVAPRRSECSSTPLPLEDEWQNFRCILVSPAGSRLGQIELLVQHPGHAPQQSKALFDDIFLIPLVDPSTIVPKLAF